MKSKILIVASDFPYPPNHGGRKDVWDKIVLLHKLDFNIDLLVTIKSQPSPQNLKEVKNYVDNIFLVERTYNLFDFISILPFQLKSRKKLKYCSLKTYYKYVILEGDYVFLLTNNNSLQYDHMILRLHNDEASYFFDLYRSEKRWLNKLYYLLEAVKFKLMQRKIIKKIKNIMFISKDEMRRFTIKFPEINPLFLPPNVNLDHFHNIHDKKLSKKVLFIGSLFMINNREGLIWYLEKIHDKVSEIDKEYSLTIAGNSNGESLDWLVSQINTCKFKHNITIIDTPSSLEEIYREHTIFINPMLHGAGVKLKTIEAIQKGLVVVSTLKGVEGTGLQDKVHVLIGKDEDEFKDKLILLLNDFELVKRLSDEAQNYAKKEFENTTKIKTYLESL
ncbi:glycosyltransferase family 4 protein [Geobacillus sp. WSUCF-018B]|uniref:glycosyltransferase family 4 protein n=1 Tax=Geobacillus sp. WSUCF-018B TaxID=2055939 RepID=UPI000C2817E6|nr:glycosyltransferase family 4 protein [Geobacillus sp. WSUCF-018B]PJW16165.1 hypothetical protein CV944_16165 [Geobacillus sp. WSUCF-018B]